MRDLGCAACDPAVSRFCAGDDVYACNPDGTVGELIEECAFESCSGGVCTDPCAAAEAARSYIGCEFWPVDLDNAVEVLGPPVSLLPGLPGNCDLTAPGAVAVSIEHCYQPANGTAAAQSFGLCEDDGSCPGGGTCQVAETCVLDAQGSPFAIVVSNPDASAPVTVTIENATGMSRSVDVAPGAVQAIYPGQLGFPDQSVDRTSQAARAFKLTSSRPVVAYQFNPLDNENVFSNDGSLLIPRHAYDAKYYAVTVPTLTRRPQTNDYNGYVTIVAWQATEVAVTPTADVRAANGIAAIPAGTTRTFTLQPFDVVNLEAAPDGDLTGTLIESVDGNTFGVFVGHEATLLQDPANAATPRCCADHIEEQLFPASAWGKEYAVAISKQRNGERDMLRIVAQRDGTTVTFDPAPASGSCGTLAAGQFCEVFVAADTLVRSPEPILVAHYLLSVIEANPLTGTSTGNGDPAIAIAIPYEQYRDRYTFLIPQQYDEQYISLVVPAGGTAALDGADVTGQLAPFAGGAFLAGRIAVAPGQHRLECPATCGFEAYGYSDAVSYLFAGGLDLEQIVVD
ncbi:MAG: hypothetical protein D6689_10760 [Deltaproteobacteria bacterium]|nr:MAG: hypothetical protein D6689_10760 [Deltaproteobacteria bacterium]